MRRWHPLQICTLAIATILAVGAARRTIAGGHRPGVVVEREIPRDRPDERRRPRRRLRRRAHARPAGRDLRRGSERRRVQERQRRRVVGAGLRPVDAMMSIGAIAVSPVESQRRLGRAPAKRTTARARRGATASTSRPTRARRGRRMGLNETRSIGRIVIDPANPDIVYVAARGPPVGTERRARRLQDDRRRRDLEEDAVRQRQHRRERRRRSIRAIRKSLYAATYQRERKSWGFNGGGPGSGIYKSTDGGDDLEETDDGTAGWRHGPDRPRHL